MLLGTETAGEGGWLDLRSAIAVSRAVAGASLNDLAPLAGTDANGLMEKLAGMGVTVSDPGASLQSLAGSSGRNAEELAAAILGGGAAKGRSSRIRRAAHCDHVGGAHDKGNGAAISAPTSHLRGGRSSRSYAKRISGGGMPHRPVPPTRRRFGKVMRQTMTDAEAHLLAAPAQTRHWRAALRTTGAHRAAHRRFLLPAASADR